MKLKYFIVFILLITCFPVFGQTTEYKKIKLSLSAGMDYPIGTSDTPGVGSEIILPFSKGFSATFDGAYFFMKNYGVGLKYHYFSAKVKNEWQQIRPNEKYVEFTFNETTQFIGPAFYVICTLSDSKWEIPANIGIGYVYNKISNHHEKVYEFATPNFPDMKHYGITDMTSNTAGVVISAGIRYRITPTVNVDVYTDGMFSNTKKQNITNILLNEPATIDVSRKMNRIGFSAGLNFNF